MIKWRLCIRFRLCFNTVRNIFIVYFMASLHTGTIWSSKLFYDMDGATIQINRKTSSIRFSAISQIIIWILSKVEVINIVAITVNFAIFFFFFFFFFIIIYMWIKSEMCVISIILFAYMTELIIYNNCDIKLTILYIIRLCINTSIKISCNLLMHNVRKWSDTLAKSCSKIDSTINKLFIIRRITREEEGGEVFPVLF